MAFVKKPPLAFFKDSKGICKRDGTEESDPREFSDHCYNTQAGRFFQCRSCCCYLNMDRLSLKEHSRYKREYFENANGDK